MTGDSFSATKSLKAALATATLAGVFILISFFTPYWLQSFPSQNLPHPKFTNLGLWEVCLNGFHDMRHQYDTRFYGCKHILIEEYQIILDEIRPPLKLGYISDMVDDELATRYIHLFEKKKIDFN